MTVKKVLKNIMGDTKSKCKRACKNCGKVHIHAPFTDCYSEKEDGSLPDDLESYYKRKFGDK